MILIIKNISKELSSVDKNIDFFGKEFEGLIKKQKNNPNDLTSGDKAAIERYKQFQQNKSRLESRKSELQKPQHFSPKRQKNEKKEGMLDEIRIY